MPRVSYERDGGASSASSCSPRWIIRRWRRRPSRSATWFTCWPVSLERLPGREPGFDETPLAILYARALQASRFERAVLLRATADTALFVSGFFAESLPGGAATSATTRASADAPTRASRWSTARGPGGRSVFDELAARFLRFVDVLAEIAEKTRLAPRLRGPALRALGGDGQPRAAALLAEQGITPVAPSGSARH